MISKVYIPRFFLSDYETKINQKLRDPGVVRGSTNQFRELLKLKATATKASASFGQLSAILDGDNCQCDLLVLENLLNSAIAATLDSQSLNETDRRHMRNTFLRLQADMREISFFTFAAYINILGNLFVGAVGVAGMGIGIAGVTESIATLSLGLAAGPFGVLALGLGLTLLSAVVAGLAAYAVYSDARSLREKQLNEIEELIDILDPQPADETLSSTKGDTETLYISNSYA